jgi:hypothetical protein
MKRLLAALFGKLPPAAAPLKRQPSQGAINEARRTPNGWVYKIAGTYDPNDAVPPDAIRGAWKVKEEGNIVGDFLPNPNFKESGSDTSSSP